MQIDRVLLIRGALLFLAAALIWAVVEMTPGRRLERRQEALLAAAGDRNWKKVRDLMAEDYRDQWGNDREEAISQASEVLRNFLTLEISSHDTSIQRDSREALVSARLRLAGRGNAFGEVVLERANLLEGHFQFAWSRKSWKPWDWKLVSLSQTEIDTMWTP